MTIFSILIITCQLFALLKAGEVVDDFVLSNGDDLRRNTFQEMIVGVHFGIPRQKCAEICRQLGDDDSCAGFTTSPITRVCILFRRANNNPPYTVQEFYLRKKAPVEISSEGSDSYQNYEYINQLAGLSATYQRQQAKLIAKQAAETLPLAPTPPPKRRHQDDAPSTPATTTLPSIDIEPSETTAATGFSTYSIEIPSAPSQSEIRMIASNVVKGYTEFNVNCLGSTMSGHRNLVTVLECARLCDFLSECQGFSYSPTLRDCFLKSARECTHPTGESSPFKFYRKDTPKAQAMLAARTREEDELVAMVDGFVDEADTTTTPRNRPTTRQLFIYSGIAKGARRSQPLPVIPSTVMTVPVTPTPKSIERLTTEVSTESSTEEAPTMATEVWTEMPPRLLTTSVNPPHLSVVKPPPFSSRRRSTFLYTPLAGNCPENNIGELLPLQYPHCAKLCDNHPACQGFAYSAIGPACILKSSPCSRPVGSQYTFYVKGVEDL